MSAVVEAIEGVVDFAGNVVESVLDDPLTAIATAAAFSMGIPFLGLGSGALAAGVANTAAGLVQGEDFDEALKGGVMAGVGSWAGQQVAGYFGGVADDAAGAAAKNAVASTGDEAAAALASSGDDIGTALASSGDEIVTAGLGDDFVGAGLGDEVAGSFGDEVAGAGLGDDVGQAWDDTLMSPGQRNYMNSSTAGGKIMPSETYTGGSSSYAGGNLAKQAAGDVIEGYGTVNGNILKSDILTKGTNLSGNTGTNAASFLDEAAGVTPKAPLDVYNQITQQPSKNIFERGLESASNELARDWSTIKNFGSGVIDDAAGAADWVGDNLIKTTVGTVGAGAAIKSMMDKKDDEEDQLNKEQEQMRKEMAEAEKTYYQPLPQYTLKRDVYTPYTEEELARYGEDPYGEGRFFSKSVYEPYNDYGAYSSYEPYTGYQEGGSVMPQAPSKINPAFAFYKYGNVPNTVRRYEDGGYARGGSRGDGRSDHIEALLSPGEFVMDAETVSLLGNGSSEAGARRLEEMRQAIRKQKGGALSKGKFSPDAKSPLAYLSKKR